MYIQGKVKVHEIVSEKDSDILELSKIRSRVRKIGRRYSFPKDKGKTLLVSETLYKLDDLIKFIENYEFDDVWYNSLQKLWQEQQ